MEGKNHITDIEAYAKEVLTAMKIDHVPLIPSNYSAYFEKNLDSKDDDTRKAILKLMEVEKNTSLDRVIDIEYKVKENFSYIKKILENVSGIYSNTSTMLKILKSREDELEVSQNAINVKNVIHSLNDDISSLKENLFVQSKDIRELYSKSSKIIRYIDLNSIYDMKYELFNKEFFQEQITNEINLIREFGHQSTIIMTKLHQKTLDQITKDKTRNLVIRTVTKVLNKKLRKSDMIAHYENNIFIVLLRHTTKETAIKVTEKLREAVKKENFFIGEQEIDINIATSLLTMTNHMEYNEDLYEKLEHTLKEADEYGNENRILFI
jgi:diguanylate cyclase (GGDEF)-like protein